jgi:S-adenosylmethionine:tRNA ribosyltransferase-isomerase
MNPAVIASPAMSLSTRDYDYELPPDLVASRPAAERAASRMLVLHRHSGRVEHHLFRDIHQFVRSDDLWIFNDTRVIPARVICDDGKSELLCLDRTSPTHWRCLVKPGKRLREGREITVGGIRGIVTHVLDNGDRMIRWDKEVDLDIHGTLALPHYMGRHEDAADRERYQTVYARRDGAVAAPTAGLHFTPEIMASLPHSFLTLHVGVGTFRPVQVDDIRHHVMHSEHYDLPAQTARQANNARRVVAVGTTVARVLEAVARNTPGGLRLPVDGATGETDIFIHPPHQFRAVDALLTNFHLPQSTLLMLVSALAGREPVLAAYRQAVEQRYRFFSYGDCMLIIDG